MARVLYHEKIGIFTDADDNHLAFTGSSNETAGGLVDRESVTPTTIGAYRLLSHWLQAPGSIA